MYHFDTNQSDLMLLPDGNLCIGYGSQAFLAEDVVWSPLSKRDNQTINQYLLRSMSVLYYLRSKDRKQMLGELKTL